MISIQENEGDMAKSVLKCERKTVNNILRGAWSRKDIRLDPMYFAKWNRWIDDEEEMSGSHERTYIDTSGI